MGAANLLVAAEVEVEAVTADAGVETEAQAPTTAVGTTAAGTAGAVMANSGD